MKKLLNISVIAALAVLPLAANAGVGDVISVTDPAHDANAAAAQTAPKYALAVEAATDTTNVATASYVKGAYNAAMKAINKVSETAGSAIQTVKVNGTALTPTDGAVNVTVAEGATNGTVAVNGADVAVHGLGSAAYTASTAYDAAGSAAAAESEAKSYADSLATNYDPAGSASAVETKLTTGGGASGYDINAKTLKVQGADVLTGASLTDYAKKTGVEYTIEHSTFTASVPTVTAWGVSGEGASTATVTVSADATYAESAN